jgi:hypothetical protein
VVVVCTLPPLTALPMCMPCALSHRYLCPRARMLYLHRVLQEYKVQYSPAIILLLLYSDVAVGKDKAPLEGHPNWQPGTPSPVS